MIPIIIGDEKFKLVFKHHFYPEPFYYSPSAPVKAYTKAILYNKANEEVMSGLAFCAFDDRFEKEKGRRLSLQKALTFASRETRKRVFEQYDGRKK